MAEVEISLYDMHYAAALHQSQLNMEAAFFIAQTLIDNDDNDEIDTNQGGLSFLLMETKFFIRWIFIILSIVDIFLLLLFLKTWK